MGDTTSHALDKSRQIPTEHTPKLGHIAVHPPITMCMGNHVPQGQTTLQAALKDKPLRAQEQIRNFLKVPAAFCENVRVL